MTFTPDRKLLAAFLGILALAAPLTAAPGDDAIAEAMAALERGDGIAAEMAGKRALDAGAPRDSVSALIGEGEFLQGDLGDAREWLEPAEYSASTRQRGFHALARLELAEDNYEGAVEAFENLLETSEGSAEVWVDIGRMRYRAGDHHGALDASRQAVELEPDHPRALEFQAQLMRDAAGLRASLPLFQKALQSAPGDTQLMAQYAAVLGDAGEYREMLQTVRQLIELDGKAPYAFYLQSILAARAGQDDLARSLWWRTDAAFDQTPSGMLLTGVLEFRSGNTALAVEHFDELRRRQPFNRTALLLYGRALLANGEANEVVAMVEPLAKRKDASNYTLSIVARAYEQLGQRAEAAVYLDRISDHPVANKMATAAFLPRGSYGGIFDPENPVTRLRRLMAEGRLEDARREVEELQARFPGSADIQLLAGDVALLAGAGEEALLQYGKASQIRTNWPLMQRSVAAFELLGRRADAAPLLSEFLHQNPQEHEAATLMESLQATSEAAVLTSRNKRHVAAVLERVAALAS